ncbi:MAG: hypothetical protein L6Q98_04075 [Anaerolineae bacterium]|nr:hypothetical protein [Anaerolineae bacterium]NUQ02641.1 hypothetical protein [Anaerolineae bacterium]
MIHTNVRFDNINLALPAQPSTFTSSLILSCGEQIHERLFRRFDARLPYESALFVHRGGRLAWNGAALESLARRWRVPVAWLVGGDRIDDAAALRPSWLAVRLAHARLRAPRRVMAVAHGIVRDTCQPYERFDSAVTAMETMYTRFAVASTELEVATTLAVALALHLGFSAGRVQRSTFTMLRIQAQTHALLRRSVQGDAAAGEALEQGRIPDHDEFQSLWAEILDQQGHRAPDEIDIASPRFFEMPEQLLASMNTASAASAGSAARYQRGIQLPGIGMIPPLRWVSEVSFLRLEFRRRTMFAFAHMRNEMLHLADRAVASGALDRREEIWNMTIGQLSELDGRL